MVAAAEELEISVAEYLQKISSPFQIMLLEECSDRALAPSTWFNPNAKRAAQVRSLARAHFKRQWEVWQALHRLYQDGG